MSFSHGVLCRSSSFTPFHKLRESQRRIQELEGVLASLKEEWVADKATKDNRRTEIDSLKGKVDKPNDMYLGKKRRSVAVDIPKTCRKEASSPVKASPKEEPQAKAQPSSEEESLKRGEDSLASTS